MEHKAVSMQYIDNGMKIYQGGLGDMMVGKDFKLWQIGAEAVPEQFNNAVFEKVLPYTKDGMPCWFYSYKATTGHENIVAKFNEERTYEFGRTMIIIRNAITGDFAGLIGNNDKGFADELIETYQTEFFKEESSISKIMETLPENLAYIMCRDGLYGKTKQKCKQAFVNDLLSRGIDKIPEICSLSREINLGIKEKYTNKHIVLGEFNRDSGLYFSLPRKINNIEVTINSDYMPILQETCIANTMILPKFNPVQVKEFEL